MDTLEAECVVIGAGVVGLACAARLVEAGREVLVIERNGAIGEETSARNSEVIHAGIYYPPGSLKASLCVEGKKKLYRYCENRNISHRRTGKLIVACDPSEISIVRGLMENGHQNGVEDLRWLGQAEIRNREPALRSVGAVWSPSTGIVDSHGLMSSLLGDLEAGGGSVAYRTCVESAKPVDGRVALTATDAQSRYGIAANHLINCAGLNAVALAYTVPVSDRSWLPDPLFSKGNYFRLSGSAPFSTLIYPAPVAGGLGVHLTLDLDNQAKFGPDVEAVDTADADLAVDASRGSMFYESIRRYWPDLPDGSLRPDYAGIRPKIRWPAGDPGQPADFAILGPGEHGVQGLLHCLGIESPGLTSSLAIADLVVKQVAR